MARWVICGTIVPPMIDMGRANEITDRATIDETIDAVRSLLERGKHVLIRCAEAKKVATDG